MHFFLTPLDETNLKFYPRWQLSEQRLFNVAGLAQHGLPKSTANIEEARAKQLPDQVDPNIFLGIRRAGNTPM